MPDDKQKGVVEIASEPAAGAEPAHVSIYVDGDRRYTIRTSDLESIGAQLRGKKRSFFGTVVMPFSITVLTVVLTTAIAHYFQYISWHNQTRLQQTSERAQTARNTYKQASDAISNRYYATKEYLKAVVALNRKGNSEGTLHSVDLKFNQKIYDDYKQQMKEWNEAYDRILSDIDFNLDRPILWYGERSDRRKVNKAKCGSETMLLTELQRLHLNVRSLKLQFAIIDHCFDKATEEFDKEINNALARADYSIAAAKYDDAAQLLEDVRSMSIEFRCFAQHRIALFDRDKRQAIFKLTRWLSQTWSAAFGNLAASTRADLKARLDKATTDCDFLTPLDDKDRFDRFAG